MARRKPPAGTGNPLDLIPTRKELEKAEAVAQLPRLKRQLTKMLSNLRQCCLKGADRSKWPEKRDYERLDEAVRRVASIIREKEPRTLWKCYTAVDHYWAGLRLLNVIQHLVKRARENIPERPLEAFVRFAGQGGPDSALARSLVSTFLRLRSGKDDPAAEDWLRYEPVFLRFRNEAVLRAGRPTMPVLQPKGNYKLSAGSAELRAYTVFLEIECEDANWCRKHFWGLWHLLMWVRNGLENVELIRELGRAFESPDVLRLVTSYLIGRSAELKRERAKERKRRQRAKKSPQKA